MRYLIENWWYLLLIAGFGYMMMKGGGCCGSGHTNAGHNHTGHNRDNSQHGADNLNNQIDMVLDPVCGMFIYPETAINQSINGKTYYFCNDSCRKSFIEKQKGFAS